MYHTSNKKPKNSAKDKLIYDLEDDFDEDSKIWIWIDKLLKFNKKHPLLTPIIISAIASFITSCIVILSKNLL